MFEIFQKWTPANRRFLAIGLAMTISAQMIFLVTEYLNSLWPLWFGNPIILETRPIDPRSLFRGNYVQLNYAISDISKDLTREDFKPGEVGYVSLKDEDGIFIATALQREKPETGIYIRGRVKKVNQGLRLRYGIEAYFMPKEKALKTEQSVRQGAHAEVYLLTSGKAAIAKLICTTGDC
ncbi:MAG: GDYXXLXY domain-containing protein [Desulfofustis sp.]|nr:GDYXXLXY domain-containing protein [Desulfofustis sp.]NNF48195.1 GDYXXLXY domain-containing protein [Desulfofustis sp.]